MIPRAPHLQSNASDDPLTSTVTSYGWISARTPSNRIRRSRRIAAAGNAPGQEPGCELLDDGAADLAADLFASIGDRQRCGQDRLRSLALGAPGNGRFDRVIDRRGGIEQGREHPTPAVGLGRLAVHDRPGQDPLGLGRMAEQLGGSSHQGIGLDPRIDHRATVARRILEAHAQASVSAASRTIWGSVDNQSIAR